MEFPYWPITMLGPGFWALVAMALLGAASVLGGFALLMVFVFSHLHWV